MNRAAASVFDAADGSLLEQVRTLRWPARRRVSGGIAGDHLSRVRGSRSEFTEYRLYRQGDDPSRIDWKLAARSDRTYVRLSNDRSVLHTVLVVDASASLAYPVASLEKWRFARQVTIGLAAAALRGGDPVGLVVAASTGLHRIAPRARVGTAQDIARMLGAIEPSGNEGLAPALTFARIPGRVAIISDFLGDTEALLKAAARLSAGNREVHAIHIVHPNELDPPRDATSFVDPERSEVRRSLAEPARERYQSAFATWRADIARSIRMSGAHYHEVVTSGDAALAVRRVVTGENTAGSSGA